MKPVEESFKFLPGFQLNLHNRNENPLFESHDPSMMKDPVSGYYYSYGTDAAITSKRKLGIPVRKSKDFVHFTYEGTVLDQKSIEEAMNYVDLEKSPGFWAPYVEYREKEQEYRMYYSATKAFGSSESKIWLAVSKHPEGPFVNRGVVVDTWFTSDLEPNGIDAHIVDSKEGRTYMIYGSFFGGIYGKELDPVSGLSIDQNPRNLGFPIAKKPALGKLDGPEGAAVMYCKERDYYYLFLSYGWLGDDYDIRVGRSKKIEGPYVDYFGKNLLGESYGLKLANSYCFEGLNPYAKTENNWTYNGFRGPGHGVPFYEDLWKEYFFVHHIRDGAPELSHQAETPEDRNTYYMHYMMIRRMLFVEDWPLLSPEPFCGEAYENPKEEDLGGNWEWMILNPESNEIIRGFFQPIHVLNYRNETGEAFLELGDYYLHGLVSLCYDYENMDESLCFVGLTEKGICIWGKKR